MIVRKGSHEDHGAEVNLRDCDGFTPLALLSKTPCCYVQNVGVGSGVLILVPGTLGCLGLGRGDLCHFVLVIRQLPTALRFRLLNAAW